MWEMRPLYQLKTISIKYWVRGYKLTRNKVTKHKEKDNIFTWQLPENTN